MALEGCCEHDVTLDKHCAACEGPQLIHIPIRSDAEVAVQFPRDITKAEAEKVARVLAAYATP